MHVAYCRWQIVDKAFGFFRSWPPTIGQRLESSLQIAELLGRSIIVALLKLIKLALQLAETALFGLIYLRGKPASIAATLLDLTNFLTGCVEISALQILASTAYVTAG